MVLWGVKQSLDKGTTQVGSWWARKDSNLGPTDYENGTRCTTPLANFVQNPRNGLDLNPFCEINTFV